jgi:hypothetical protein
MKEIEHYLQLELEKEKEKIKRESEEKKKDLIEKFEKEITTLKESQEKEFEAKKQLFLKNAFSFSEKNFYNKLVLKKISLWQDFSREILKLLREADPQTKEKINFLLIKAFKKRLTPQKDGVFQAARSALNLLKENFPEFKIEENPNLALGFYYFDKTREVEATEKAIVKKYLEKYER